MWILFALAFETIIPDPCQCSIELLYDLINDCRIYLPLFFTFLWAILGIAFLTLLERNVIGTLQRRLSPTFVCIWSIGQPLADAFKLLFKELILPCFTNRSLFLFSPWLTFIWSLLIWVIIPFGENQILCDLDLSIIFFFAVASLGSYGILVSGWSSNSKYALFGSVRSVSQMISYDVSIGILCWDLLMITSSLSLVHFRYVIDTGV